MKQKIAWLFLILMLHNQAFADCSINNNSANTCKVTSASSLTCSVTVSSGSNRVAVIGVGALNTACGSGPGSASTVTWNGNGATKIGGTTDGGTSCQQVDWWLIKEAGLSTATADLVITYGSSQTALVGGMIVFNNIDQTTTNRTLVTDASKVGTTISYTAGSFAAGDCAVDAITGWFSSIGVPGTDQTQLINVDEATNDFGISMSYNAMSGAFTWNKTSGDWHTAAAANLIPAISTTAPLPRRRRN